MKIDLPSLAPVERYRWLVHSIVPRPIAWVSTLSATGVVNLAPFSWFSTVSASPPIVSISVGSRRDGSPKDTRRNLDHLPELVISFVSESLAEPMNLTSGEWPADASELEVAGLTAASSDEVAPPRVGESPLALECRVERIVEVGEPANSLVLAEVLCLQVDPSVLTDGLPDPDKLRPLARLGGRAYAELGKLLEIARPRIAE